ncbi:MAG: ABC transporter permease, partial [Anaerolineae bacterium]
MLIYVLKRLGFLLLTLLLTSIIIFLVARWLPGDVARVILGREAGEAALQNLRQELGLNQPLPTQYVKWVAGFVTGDWGRSFSTGSEIRPLVMRRLGNSLRLALLTLGMSVPLAVGLGVLAGLKEDSLLDNVISIAALSVVGLPEFVTGLILILILAFDLNLVPANSSISPDAGFFEILPMLILPALTATLVLLAYVARLTRAGVAAEMKRPYVRTAVLKGLPYRSVVGGHVLRNALLPTITVAGAQIGWMVGGLVVVETLFRYPGIGSLTYSAATHKDLPLLVGCTLTITFVFACANFLADLLYA